MLRQTVKQCSFREGLAQTGIVFLLFLAFAHMYAHTPTDTQGTADCTRAVAVTFIMARQKCLNMRKLEFAQGASRSTTTTPHRRSLKSSGVVSWHHSKSGDLCLGSENKHVKVGRGKEKNESVRFRKG